MSDALKRAVRTFVQAWLGWIVTSGVLSTFDTGGVVNWSDVKKVALAAVGAGITAVISYAQNALEDNTSVPTLLKTSNDTPTPPAAAPGAANAG